MITRSLTRAFITFGVGLLVSSAAQLPAFAQEWLPNPALEQVRAATSANGGIEGEWQYHKPIANRSISPVVPISKFAGGRGMCTPTCVAPYYGCDRSGTCHRTSHCGCR